MSGSFWWPHRSRRVPTNEKCMYIFPLILVFVAHVVVVRFGCRIMRYSIEIITKSLLKKLCSESSTRTYIRREWTCFSSVFHRTTTTTATSLRHTKSFSFRYWGECGDKRYNKNNNNKFIHKLYVVNLPIGGQHEALNEHSIYTRLLGCYQHTCSFVILAELWNRTYEIPSKMFGCHLVAHARSVNEAVAVRPAIFMSYTLLSAPFFRYSLRLATSRYGREIVLLKCVCRWWLTSQRNIII